MPGYKKEGFQVHSTPEEKEAAAAKTVGGVFISVTLMIFAMLLAIAYYYAYQRSQYMFSLVFVILTFLYAVAHVGLFAALRHKLRPVVFQIYIGGGVFVSFMAILVAIFLYMQHTKRGGSGPRTEGPSLRAPEVSDGMMGYAPA